VIETPMLKRCLDDLDIRNPTRRRIVVRLVMDWLRTAAKGEDTRYEGGGAGELFAAASIIRKVCLLLVEEEVATMAATPISTSVN
jgi:hypothetical protein